MGRTPSLPQDAWKLYGDTVKMEGLQCTQKVPRCKYLRFFLLYICISTEKREETCRRKVGIIKIKGEKKDTKIKIVSIITPRHVKWRLNRVQRFMFELHTTIGTMDLEFSMEAYLRGMTAKNHFVRVEPKDKDQTILIYLSSPIFCFYL